MPLALLALTISAFAIGTTEFVIVGLVPTIAEQLAISLPSAGLLVSIYALGVAVGAPVLTALTGRFPRKQLLVALMVLFTAGNILAWQAPDYTTLVIARLLTGLAQEALCCERVGQLARKQALVVVGKALRLGGCIGYELRVAGEMKLELGLC